MDIPAPKTFSFDAAKWPEWMKRFERFRIASDLASKPGARQVAMLIYCMGPQAEEIHASFTYEDGESENNFSLVMSKFDTHFVVRKNIIYERAKFNTHRQELKETADQFIIALHTLADRCAFGDLREELIRDRLVVGIREARLGERLQLDPDLTLAKAVDAVRQFEQVRQQQGFLHGTMSNENTGDPTAVNSMQVRSKASKYSTKTVSAKHHKQMKQTDAVQQQQQRNKQFV
jgi:hypothetical protein